MKMTIQLEELAMTLMAIYLLTLHHLGLPVWLWVILFFTPDIGMLGYVINTRFGAFTYNLLHHKGIALLLVAMGYYWPNELLTTTGILIFAHASFDRIMGYGLKYADSFKNTHLGRFEKK